MECSQPSDAMTSKPEELISSGPELLIHKVHQPQVNRTESQIIEPSNPKKEIRMSETESPFVEIQSGFNENKRDNEMVENESQETIDHSELIIKESDSLHEEMDLLTNPWKVTNLDEFLFYCCPECDLKVKGRDEFSQHAMEKHEQAKEVLNDLDIPMCSIVIKEEPEEYEEMEGNENRSKNHPNKKKINEEVDCPYCFESMPQNVFKDHIDSCYQEHDFEDKPISQQEDTWIHVNPGKRTKKFVRNHKGSKTYKYPDGSTVEGIKCPDCHMKLHPRSIERHQKVCSIRLQKGPKQYNYAGKMGKSGNECPYCFETFSPNGIFQHIEICNKKPEEVDNPKSELYNQHEDLEGWLDTTVKTEKEQLVKPKAPRLERIKCDICEKTGILGEKALLMHHRIKHPEEYARIKKETKGTKGRHKCDQCDFRCQILMEMRAHIRAKHHKRKNYTCDLCQRSSFGTLAEVERHKRGQHFGEEVYNCTLCDFKTTAPGKLHLHRKNEHLNKSSEFEYEVCDLCGKTLKNANALKKHMKKEHSENVEVMCDICGKTCKSDENLRTHIKDTHFKYFICTICDTFYKSKRSLVNHYSEAHQVFCKQTHVYVCSIAKCQEKFDSSRQLSQHMQNEHSLNNLHRCSKCDFTFPTPTLVTVHLLECHDFDPFKDSTSLIPTKVKVIRDPNLDKPFKCDFCDTRFNLKRTMAIHIKQKHLTDNHIKCDKCDFTAYSDYVLRKHVLERHAPQTLYPCDKCSYSTNKRSQLTHHIQRVHEKISAFQCSECQKEITGKKKYAEHLLSVHNIVYQYKN